MSAITAVIDGQNAPKVSGDPDGLPRLDIDPYRITVESGAGCQ